MRNIGANINFVSFFSRMNELDRALVPMGVEVEDPVLQSCIQKTALDDMLDRLLSLLARIGFEVLHRDTDSCFVAMDQNTFQSMVTANKTNVRVYPTADDALVYRYLYETGAPAVCAFGNLAVSTASRTLLKMQKHALKHKESHPVLTPSDVHAWQSYGLMGLFDKVLQLSYPTFRQLHTNIAELRFDDCKFAICVCGSKIGVELHDKLYVFGQ